MKVFAFSSASSFVGFSNSNTLKCHDPFFEVCATLRTIRILWTSICSLFLLQRVRTYNIIFVDTLFLISVTSVQIAWPLILRTLLKDKKREHLQSCIQSNKKPCCIFICTDLFFGSLHFLVWFLFECAPNKDR